MSATTVLTSVLTSEFGVSGVQAVPAALDLDGRLLYELRGPNWISGSLLGVETTTRRSFDTVCAGIRSEIDVHRAPEGPEVTPGEPQDPIFRRLDD